MKFTLKCPSPFGMLTLLGGNTRKITPPPAAKPSATLSFPEAPTYPVKGAVDIRAGSTVLICYEDGSTFVGKATVVTRKGEIGIRVDLYNAGTSLIETGSSPVMYECLTANEIESLKPVANADYQFSVRLERDLFEKNDEMSKAA